MVVVVVVMNVAAIVIGHWSVVAVVMAVVTVKSVSVSAPVLVPGLENRRIALVRVASHWQC